MADDGNQQRKPDFRTAVEDVKASATVPVMKLESILRRRADLRSPAVLAAIGVAATLVLALMVVITLLLITLLLTGDGNIARLIPVGAAIIGGLIGFSGAMIASRRANKTAYDLVSYSRVQDRRYDALATLYGYAQQLYEVLHSASQADDAPSLLKGIMEHETIEIEANVYLRKNMLWLPGEAKEAFTELLLATSKQAEKLRPPIDEIEVASMTSEEYFDWFESQGKQNQQEVIDWFRNQGYEMLEKLHHKYADMVGLEKTDTSSLFPE